MSDADSSKRFRKRRVRQFARRGYVYSWLRAYYSQVATGLESGEQSWPSLVAAMARDGVTGRDGGKLTANAALKVWRRVCRDVDADAVARAGAAPKPKYPSRISPNWRPQVVEPLPGSPLSSPAAISAGTSGREVGAGSGKTEEEGLSPHAREQYARMDEQLAKLDRKFRF
jgi:hypothetical protein